MEIFTSELDIKKPQQSVVNCSMIWKETHLPKQVEGLVKVQICCLLKVWGYTKVSILGAGILTWPQIKCQSTFTQQGKTIYLKLVSHY